MVKYWLGDETMRTTLSWASRGSWVIMLVGGMVGLSAVGAQIAPVSTASADDPALQALREKNARVQLANYPRGALRRGEQGTVGISVTVDRQGRLRECAVSKSSGFASLDEATCDFLFSHAQIAAYVAPGGGGPTTRQEGQVVWTLPAGVRPTTASATAGPLPEKKICRAQARTGSLVASQRICLTKAEWRRQYELAQDETREMHTRAMPGD